MRIYSKLRLVAGLVAADLPAPDGQLHEGPELHQAVAEPHQRGHHQLVQVPTTQSIMKDLLWSCSIYTFGKQLPWLSFESA